MSDATRLARIEERLAALERAVADEGAPVGDRPATGDRPTFWVLDGLRQDGSALSGGAVVYAGSVRLPGGQHYTWQRTHGADDARGEGAEEGRDAQVTAALAALAHPVRLRLLRAVLTGRGSTAELAALPDLGTTGQLHHHLRQLVTAGWLRTASRGQYTVPPDRVVPLHVVLAAVLA